MGERDYRKCGLYNRKEQRHGRKNNNKSGFSKRNPEYTTGFPKKLLKHPLFPQIVVLAAGKWLISIFVPVGINIFLICYQQMCCYLGVSGITSGKR